MTYLDSLFRVVKEVNSYFQPDAIVCQCGVDGLAGDPMNSFNLTQYGLGASVHYISSLEKPLLLLGGGKNDDIVRILQISNPDYGRA